MDQQNISPEGVASQLGDYLASEHAILPRIAEAVKFLKALDETGRHNLVAIDPTTGRVEGKTFEPGDWQGIAIWIENRNGRKNLYFTVNEPKAGVAGKPSKHDIAALRALYSDVDHKTGDLDIALNEIRDRIDAFSVCAVPPTFIVNTGGGYQPIWKLSEKLDPTEHKAWAEEQGRGLADALGGDGVQNIDRLLRLPGTLNIPTPEKLKKGRVERPARLEKQEEVTYTPDQLRSAVKPISTTEAADADEKIAAVQAGLDMAEIQSAATYDDLPEDIRDRFEAARRNNSKLDLLWQGELAGDDQSGSAFRASLVARLTRIGGFTVEDFGRLAWVWNYAVQDGDDREEKITARTIARDWVRMGRTPERRFEDLAARWFEEPPLEDPFGAETHGAPKEREKIAWLDPTNWVGEPPPREWEVDGWIPKNEVTLLYGDGAIGKSLLIHQYATCAATGRLWLGQRTRPARVMCFFCEDDEQELHRRQYRINAMLGVGFSDLARLRLVSRKNEDNLLALWNRDTGAMRRQPVWEQLRDDAVAFGADVVIVDTIADTFGGSEIDRGQVNGL
jgi:hypothetical protein